MKFLLDTHAVIWAVENDPRLGNQARNLLSTASGEDVAISDISLLEISMLHQKGRLSVKSSVKQYLRALQEQFVVLSIEADIAAEAMTLDLEQGDPFDRVLVATARTYHIPLLTRDRQICQSGLVSTFW